MSHQLIIKGSLRRARFTLGLDLNVDLTKPLGIMGATGAGKTALLLSLIHISEPTRPY